MQNGRVLITGGAGMIGSHLIDELIKQNPECQIIILDDFSVGRETNLPAGINIKTVHGSVLDKLLVVKLLAKSIRFII